MIFQQAVKTRRLVGRIEDGEDVVESLTKLCREHDVRAGQVRLIGELRSVELVRYDAEAGDYVTAHRGEGDFALVTANGNISRMGEEVVVRLEGVLSAQGPAGPQLLSGQIRRSEAVSCEFVVETFDDLAIERRLDADSGRLVMHAIRRTESRQNTEEKGEPQATAEPVGGKGMSWGDAAREAEQASQSPASTSAAAGKQRSSEERSPEDIYGDLDFEEPLIESGDILEHPKLGRCRVMKVEEGEFVHVRLPRGRIRKLSLEIIDVEFDREEDGRRVFKARVGS